MKTSELLSSWDLLRYICAAFFVPHFASKVTHPGRAAAFFEAAGLVPSAWFARAAIVVEILFVLALGLDVLAREAAMAAAAFLGVAALAVLKVSRGKWLWAAGGCEYPVFWMLCCVAVALGR